MNTLSLNDIDTSHVQIQHAFCESCHPEETPRENWKTLCGGDCPEIKPPEDSEKCIVCMVTFVCPECKRRLQEYS